MTIQACRVDRRTTRAIAAMSGGLSVLTMRSGWRAWFAAGCQPEDAPANPSIGLDGFT
jgi:hypothetical protein